MPRPVPEHNARAAALDQALDRALRGFARLGAVIVAAVAVAARTGRGRRAATALDARLAQADRLAARHNDTLAAFANRALAWLDRLFAARN